MSDNFPPSTIILRYLHKVINIVGFERSEFTSEIEIRFDSGTYRMVYDVKKTMFEKLYSEPLSEEEIKDLVSYEAKQHKEFIENKLKEFEEKEKQEFEAKGN